MSKHMGKLGWLIAGLLAVVLTVNLVSPALADMEDLDDYSDEEGWYDEGWYEDNEDWKDEDWYEDDEKTLSDKGSRFPDVPATANYAEAVEALADWGVIIGKSSGLFDPNAYITRGEMATIMCRSLNVVPAPGCSRFADVASHWSAGYVETASAYGIINGDGAGNFWPDGYVTYEQAVKMIVCGCEGGEDYAQNHGAWPSGYLQAGLALGLMDDLPANTAAPTQRSTVAQLIYNAMILD